MRLQTFNGHFDGKVIVLDEPIDLEPKTAVTFLSRRGLPLVTLPGMERTVHKARDFRSAEEWDVAQQIRMTPRERWAAARQLKNRVYGRKAKDVRECHRTK